MSEDHLHAILSLYLFSTGMGVFFGSILSFIMVFFRVRRRSRPSDYSNQ